MSALKYIRHVFFLILIFCLVWVMCTVLFFHASSLSQSISMFSKSRLLRPSNLHRKLAMLLPALRKMKHSRAKLSNQTRPASEHHIIGKHFQHKRRSRANDGAQIRQADASNHSHKLQNNPKFQSFSKNVQKAVSKMRMIRSEDYLVQHESFFTPRNAVVDEFHTKWLIQTTCPPEDLFLLIIVPSVYSHKVRRTAVRETWGSLAYGHAWPGITKLWNDSVKLIFFLGISNSRKYHHEHLFSEAQDFGDIVVGDFIDSYQNLSLKMATVLQWVDLFCASAKHVLKVDEDTFVHLPLLLDVLSLFSATHSNFVMGHKIPKDRPSVMRDGHWKVDTDIYPFPYYPQYVYGHSYVISGDAMSSLRHVSRHLPLIPNEDVYVTGVLAKSAGIQRVGSWRFAVVGRNHQRCHLLNGIHISQTGFSSSALYAVWDRFKAGNCSDPE